MRSHCRQLVYLLPKGIRSVMLQLQNIKSRPAMQNGSSSLPQLMDIYTVRRLHLDRFSMHQEIFSFIIHRKDSYCIVIMIQAHKMFPVWKHCNCFREFSANTVIAHLCQKSCLLIHSKYKRCINPGICTEQLISVW